MVLQQQSTVRLWGWCSPGEKIKITTSWSSQVDSAIGTRDANWIVSLKTPAAGGPFTITLTGQNTIVLENVMIGEVWICSGQSNMEWSSLNGLKQMDSILPKSANNNIRFFQVPKTTSSSPQDNINSSWQNCSPETLKSFSAVGYFFGKKLQANLNIPIGLINSSWGGTPAEVWAPAELIEKNGTLAKAATLISPALWWPNDPGKTYNAMIAPLTQFEIAGAIWYQGESNTANNSTYQLLFTSMIDAWRKAWKKEIPFYFVQIAPFHYGNKNVGMLVREQQTASMKLPNTGMVVITDLVDNIKDIHPQNKIVVGERLADWALAQTYKKSGIAYKSPTYKNMTVNKDKAEIYFNDAPNGFILKGNKATEWYIAGEDKQFLPAEVKMEKDRVIVFNKKIPKQVAVRFAFSNTAIANIFSKEGLPVNPFRTDDWIMDTSTDTQ
jgi:sialate O-acetylesterase